MPPTTSTTPTVFAGSIAYNSHRVGPVLSVGNFDGVHLGHRWLLDKVVARARELNVPSCIYTFDPPPRVVLAPSLVRPRIVPWPDKIQLLGDAGIDHVIVERFTPAFAQHPPAWFVDEVIGQRIAPTEMLVGYDFRFGRARAGDIGLIRKRLPDLPIQQASAFESDGVVSSSRIRSLVQDGDVSEAALLLGRPHSIRGTVVQGDKRGRQIGFPTANLHTSAELIPPQGVYATRVRINTGDWRPAVANLGARPTFDKGGFTIEVHVLDFSETIYGAEVELAFVDRLRGEERFADIIALQRQIRKDVENARARLEDAR